MKKLKYINLSASKKPILFLLVCLLVIGTVFFSVTLINAKSSQNFEVTVQDFPPGTQLSYKLFSNGNYLREGTAEIDQNGKASIGDERDFQSKDIVDLKYEIDLQKANIDEMMDVKDPVRLSLAINKTNRSVGFSGSGFPEFSNIALTSGSETEVGKTDWSGMFSETGVLDKNLNSDPNQMIKIAFQNMNFGSDANAFSTNGAVEVFFGDPDGSSIPAVLDRYGYAIRLMTLQLSAIMMKQVEMIGTLFDAKTQLETQQKFQELQARAHKDYHPSEQMCRFGTFIKSIAATESKSDFNKRVLNRYLMDQYLGVENSSAEYGVGTSMRARIDHFKSIYCDPYDNNGKLTLLCDGHTGATTVKQRERYNKDIDFTRTLDNKLTLNIDFSDTNLTPDEEDVMTLAQNLYFAEAFAYEYTEGMQVDLRSHYNTRTFAAKMNVAHNSFVQIVGMKSSAPIGTKTKDPALKPPPQMLDPRSGVPPLPNYIEDTGWTYMKSMMREFGISDRNGNGTSDDEIQALLGARPSYYAQMEVLTKKIYQNPDFYTNLYDKPVNVDRIGVAMDAISIMNQRDRYESLLRREMLTSLLVEEALVPEVESVNARMLAAMQKTQTRTP